MNRSAYEEIMALRGYEGFKKLAGRLRHLAEIRDHMAGTRIRVPNFLFVEAPGAGVTTQLKLLTRLLMEEKLTPFMGEKRFFEWALDENAFETGGSFDRLLMARDAAAGFYGQFRGVIGIELGTWTWRTEDLRIRRLLDFASDVYGQIVLVFITEEQDARELEALEKALNQATPLEVMRCPLPGPGDMAQYLLDFLWERGFAATREAQAAVEAFMPDLMATEDFEGLKTMNILADEIVFRACCKDRGEMRVAGKKEDMNAMPLVRAEDLGFIAGEAGYIARHTARSSRRGMIGFGREEDARG